MHLLFIYGTSAVKKVGGMMDCIGAYDDAQAAFTFAMTVLADPSSEHHIDDNLVYVDIYDTSTRRVTRLRKFFNQPLDFGYTHDYNLPHFPSGTNNANTDTGTEAPY